MSRIPSARPRLMPSARPRSIPCSIPSAKPRDTTAAPTPEPSLPATSPSLLPPAPAAAGAPPHCGAPAANAAPTRAAPPGIPSPPNRSNTAPNPRTSSATVALFSSLTSAHTRFSGTPSSTPIAPRQPPGSKAATELRPAPRPPGRWSRAPRPPPPTATPLRSPFNPMRERSWTVREQHRSPIGAESVKKSSITPKQHCEKSFPWVIYSPDCSEAVVSVDARRPETS